LGILNQRDKSMVLALLHYDGYLDKQRLEVDKFKDLEAVNIPDDTDFSEVPGLSHEVRQKLMESKPFTLAQASRISGVTPAAISCLMIWLNANRKVKG